ncbi:MAG TPA: hypothetical protein VK504_09400 [Vicinamibacterales bacterium]|nr:hypothetical protein [Vicinamibacterales bacterium]
MLAELDLIHEPAVTGVEIGLVHGPVSVMRNGFRIDGDRTPEVCDEGIEIVDRFDARRRWAAQ